MSHRDGISEGLRVRLSKQRRVRTDEQEKSLTSYYVVQVSLGPKVRHTGTPSLTWGHESQDVLASIVITLD